MIELNQWAGEKRFRLKLSEGIKKLKKSHKKTVACVEKHCKFKMILSSEDNIFKFQTEE